MKWYHMKTGRGPYKITGFSVRESDLAPMVHYRAGPTTRFARPAAEFFDGRFGCLEAYENAKYAGSDLPRPPPPK